LGGHEAVPRDKLVSKSKAANVSKNRRNTRGAREELIQRVHEKFEDDRRSKWEKPDLRR